MFDIFIGPCSFIRQTQPALDAEVGLRTCSRMSDDYLILFSATPTTAAAATAVSAAAAAATAAAAAAAGG